MVKRTFTNVINTSEEWGPFLRTVIVDGRGIADSTGDPPTLNSGHVMHAASNAFLAVRKPFTISSLSLHPVILQGALRNMVTGPLEVG